MPSGPVRVETYTMVDGVVIRRVVSDSQLTTLQAEVERLRDLLRQCREFLPGGGWIETEVTRAIGDEQP